MVVVPVPVVEKEECLGRLIPPVVPNLEGDEEEVDLKLDLDDAV